MIKEAKRVRWPGKRNDLPDFIKIKGAMLSELFTGLTDGTFSFSILLLFDYRVCLYVPQGRYCYFNALTISAVVLGLFME